MLYTRYVKNLVAGCLIMASSSIVAATINFPGIYPTLQATVNAAVSGDTINIIAGINGGLSGNHDVNISGKTLTFNGNDYIIDLGSGGRLFNITNSNVTIQNWKIQNGSSTSTSVGGAIYNDSSSTLTISNCTFNYNTATTNGGAIYNATGARLNVSNSTFGTNTATTDGGAIYNAGIATLDTGCSFTGNRAAIGCGGAIYDAAGATLNVLSSTFDSNTAPNYDSGAIEGRGTLRIESCDFSNNSALDAGAIMIRKISNSLVKNCSFNNNNASYAGAFYNNGTVALENCIFIGNRSDHGGAICGFSGNLSIDRCVFIKNSATAEGGAIVLYSVGSFTMGCCRFAGNTAVTGGDAIYSDTWINAFNNWWGTNTPTVPDLISDRINYNPWITMSLSTTPSTITPGGMSTIDLTFSNTCIPVTPVAFSTTDGILTPTLANTVDGKASSTFNAVYSDLLSVVGTAGPDAENYSLTLTLTVDQVVRNLLLTKVAYPTTVNHAGQIISYTYTVSNAGNIYLNDVILADNKVIPVFNPPDPLNPGAVATGTATYTVSQSDMDAGSITNEAIVTGTSEAGVSVTNNAIQTVNTTQNPGLSIIKKINNSSLSLQKPGVVVASDSMMDISYIITNIGNVTLNVEVTDNQGYEIIPSTTTLIPDASITCTAQTYAPDINQLHKNIGTATGTTALSTVVTASAPAYATSVPVNRYRFNFGCICSDRGEEHILIGSHNMPSLDGNSLDFWVFNETPTASFINSLDLGQKIIMDSATYNTDSGMNIAVLTQTQQGNTSIVLVTYDGVSAVLQSTKPLSSRAFKAQWFVAPNSTPYIITDAQGGMSLYEVDPGTYNLKLSSSVPNLGAGTPSTFLRWYSQGDSFYVIQGYNKTSIATYKVDLTKGIIKSGVTTDLSTTFTAVHSCATCYENLILGGGSNAGQGLLARGIVETGELTITQTVSIPDTSVVNYCERCCCGDNPILVGTDYGLYSLNADTLDIIASNTLMPNNDWINTCWCCDVTGDYCIAVNSDHETYVFQQDAPLLNMVLQLPN